MGAIIDIVLPAFCLIGFGYVIARLNYLGEPVGDALADFVFKVAVPVLLMRSIATAEFGENNPWFFALAYFMAIAVVWLVAMALIRFVFKRGARAAVIAGLGASYSNLILLGIPLTERAFGEPGLQMLFFLISIHLPTMMMISTFLMEYAVRADGVESAPLRPLVVIRNLARNLAVNPIIVGIFIGIIWRFSGIGVGGTVGQLMDLLSQTTGPLALIALGMGVIKYGIGGNVIAAVSLSVLSLLAMPATIVLINATVLPLPPLWFKVAVLIAACPIGVNAYLFATYFKVAEGLSSSVIVLSLLGSIITIPLWLSFI